MTGRSRIYPTSAGGVGRGRTCTSLRVCPRPNPPPQAGEGTHRVCRAAVRQSHRRTLLIRAVAPPFTAARRRVAWPKDCSGSAPSPESGMRRRGPKDRDQYSDEGQRQDELGDGDAGALEIEIVAA